MKAVSPKKKLGQHFLNDLNIAQKIADLLQNQNSDNILEIGPGMGVLTQFLIPKIKNLKLVEIDTESVTYLNRKYPELQKNTSTRIFLKWTSPKPLMAKPLALLETSLTTFRAKSYSKPWNTVNIFLFFAACSKKKSPKGSAKNPEPKPMAYSQFCVKPITTPNTISMFPPLCFLPHQK